MNAPAESPAATALPVFDSAARVPWWRHYTAAFAKGELIAQLTWRNLRAGRKQSLLGLGWIVLHPLVQLGVFTVLFTKIFPLSGGAGAVPYALLVFPALVVWGFFTRAVSASAGCVVDNAPLVRKTYFPREVLVYVSIATYAINVAVNALVAAALMAWYGHAPTVHALYVPVILLAVLFYTAGLSLVVAALNVFWRDVESLLPLAMQAWFFATPVVYPISQVPEALRPLFRLNPLAAPMEALRVALLEGRAPDLPDLGNCLVAGFVCFVLGLFIFKRCERHFADLI
ncbi:MAG: ABC transporter permease [Planctomycetes bacterium]|nr:ABC transporter permease [Planctomycetota bacterium]